MNILILLLPVAAVALPSWLILVVVVPLASGILPLLADPNLISIGDVDLLVVDVMLVAVSFKVAIVLLAKGETARLRHELRAVRPLLTYLAVMALSTLVAWHRFGGAIFGAEIVAFLRLLSQISVYFLLVLSLRDSRQVRYVSRATILVGVVLASTVYAGMLFEPFGITLGEITVSEEASRYHGILGDSVKLYLLPFIFWAVLAKAPVMLIFFTFALIASGGRAGLVGLLAGSIVLGLYRSTGAFRGLVARRSVVVGVAGLFVLVAVGLYFDIGGLWTRFFVAEILDAGLGRHLSTWLTSLRIFMSGANALLGVGYGGYAFMVREHDTPWVFGQHYPPFDYDPFSQILKSAVDGGFIGVAVFLWMMSRFVRSSHRGSMVSSGALHAFLQAGFILVVTLLILSMFTTWLLPASQISYLLWVFLAVARCDENDSVATAFKLRADEDEMRIPIGRFA